MEETGVQAAEAFYGVAKALKKKKEFNNVLGCSEFSWKSIISMFPVT